MVQRTRDLPGTSRYVTTDGVTLHVRAVGPEDGPLAVLLHGFPEFWYGWRHQLDALAGAGYRVLIPDQRGYNLSDKPEGTSAYRVDRLVEDVVGLLDDAGAETARVVGHDWGAMVAWCLALDRPGRVERLGILNVPHPAAFGETLREDWRQGLRSWYAGFFQLPRVPERVLRAREFELLTRALTDGSRPGTFSEVDLARYRTAWGRPGALTAMLNWYRANGLRSDLFDRRGRVSVPTLVLWGARDTALVRENAARSVEYCDDADLVLFEDATHWLQHEKPEAVNGHLVEFLD
ncbi:alpha/beta fold hydrolase [Halomarina ordinaria]|uniref:Alpha/beta fold hydrolase n=1 Tax=Halomarina ordinaria TaxID=3033939 RepID=A0ABD5U7T2_9EURY|nr:alpha/beta hydrolase [Halomarina sp. PSRA2]